MVPDTEVTDVKAMGSIFQFSNNNLKMTLPILLDSGRHIVLWNNGSGCGVYLGKGRELVE